MSGSEYMERWNAISVEERRGTLDAYHHFSDRNWAAYECADCHPDTWDEDSGGSKPELPCTVIAPSDIGAPKHCPRCGSYLGMATDDPTLVQVTTLVLS